MNLASHRPDLRRIGESSFREVLETLLPMPVTLRELAANSPISIVPDQITSWILLTGPRLSGSVRIQLPRPFVARVVRVLTGLDGAAAETKALLDDAAGEIANMVAGRVAVGLAATGYVCTLGMPSVACGTPVPIEIQSGVDQGRIDLLCEGYCLSLEVHCCFTSP